MLNIVDFSVNIFNTIITFFSANYFFSSFEEKKKHVIINVLSIISFIAFFISLSYVESKIVNMIIMISCMFTITLKYKFKLYNKFLFTVLFVVISALAELIAGLFIMIIFSLDSVSAESGVYYSLGVMLSKFLALIFFFVIRSFKHRLLSGKFKKNWIVIYMLPLSTILIIFVEYFSMIYYPDNDTLKTTALISMIFLIFSNMLIFKIADGIIESLINENKIHVAEEIIKQQTEQYNFLLKNNEDILKLKHDYKNFIIGILAEIKSENYSNIENRLTEQANVLDKFSGDSISGNSIVDTVLRYKTSFAKSKNIDVIVTYKNLQNIYISGIDMSILLGNALDNAIEAVELVEDTDLKRIEVFVYIKNSQIYIIVKNPVKTNINVEHLQTTKKNNFGHGYGILNMRSIVQKYEGSVTFDCEGNVFSTLIVLNNTSE